MTLSHVFHPRARRFSLETPVRFRTLPRVEGGVVATQPGERTFALTIDAEEFGWSERERLTAQPGAGQNGA